MRIEPEEGWNLSKENGLTRQFVFKDFSDCFAFMTQMAIYSDKKNHHPEWSNVYNKVTIHLITHDAGKVTEKDTDWAKKANKTAAKYNPQQD